MFYFNTSGIGESESNLVIDIIPPSTPSVSTGFILVVSGADDVFFFFNLEDEWYGNIVAWGVDLRIATNQTIPDSGSCCTPEGQCIADLTELQCNMMSGIFHLNENCTSDLCNYPRGACCNGIECTETTDIDCSIIGGIYIGDNVSCNGYVCGNAEETGACCIDEICSIQREIDCLAAGGFYLGDGPNTDCDDEFICNFDGESFGACCKDGICFTSTPSLCEIKLGTFIGPNTTCESATCGSCCFSDAVGPPSHPYCKQLTEEICEDQGGTFWQGVGCSWAPCLGVDGACCYGCVDGVCEECIVTTPIDCDSFADNIFHQGSQCSSTLCGIPEESGACCYPDPAGGNSWECADNVTVSACGALYGILTIGATCRDDLPCENLGDVTGACCQCAGYSNSLLMGDGPNGEPIEFCPEYDDSGESNEECENGGYRLDEDGKCCSVRTKLHCEANGGKFWRYGSNCDDFGWFTENMGGPCAFCKQGIAIATAHLVQPFGAWWLGDEAIDTNWKICGAGASDNKIWEEGTEFKYDEHSDYATGVACSNNRTGEVPLVNNIVDLYPQELVNHPYILFEDGLECFYSFQMYEHQYRCGDAEMPGTSGLRRIGEQVPSGYRYPSETSPVVAAGYINFAILGIPGFRPEFTFPGSYPKNATVAGFGCQIHTDGYTAQKSYLWDNGSGILERYKWYNSIGHYLGNGTSALHLGQPYPELNTVLSLHDAAGSP